mmetsp:Transcript_67538/g.109525  ORF Transcript_67538/g.109525 Transcript_67538/m.109525 type:complete len:144 (+) Transcript_67538:466-897(+)
MCAAASLTLKLLMTTTGRNHCQNCQQPFAVLLAGREYPSCCVLLCTFSGLCMAQLCNSGEHNVARLCTVMYICADEKVGPAAGICDKIQTQAAAQKACTILLLVPASLCGCTSYCHVTAGERALVRGRNRCVLCLQIQYLSCL